MADKLANVSALRDDLERNGHIDWSRFNEGRAGQAWYHGEIANAAWGWGPTGVAQAYIAQVEAVFGPDAAGDAG